MKKLLVLCIIISFNNLFAQEYFNKIIPFEFGNPYGTDLYFYNNKCIIPVIYYSSEGDVSTLIETDGTLHNYHHYNYFVFSNKSLSLINNQMYLFAKDRSIKKGLKYKKLNNDFSEKWTKSYDTEGSYDFPTSSINIDNYLYCSFFMKFGDVHMEIGIKKIDTLGNEIWSKNYDANMYLSYPWEIQPTLDNNILLTSGIVYYNKVGIYSKLIKIDTSGNILWETEGTEAFKDGGVSPWIAELSDSSIVQSYRKDMHYTQEYVDNNWNLYPYRLKWYDKNGNPTHEILLPYPKKNSLYFSQIEVGKGDYFFAYGQYRVDEPDDQINDYKYGLITKYSNKGDTLWTHRYQHPDFDTSNVVFRVIDIEELDNGDIVAMGDITPPGERSNIWLFKVNKYGCFSSDSCNEIVVGTEDFIDIGENAHSIKIYPNPASDFIIVELGSKFQTSTISWGVYDMEGRKVLGGNFNSGLKLQTSNIKRQTSNIVQLRLSDIQTPGVYFLRVKDDKGKVGVAKFVVE